jgi:hypothetical protein
MDDVSVRQTGPATRRRFGARARWMAGLAAVMLAGGSALGVSLSGTAAPQMARAALTGSASGDNGGGTPAGLGVRDGGAAHRVTARLRTCVPSARRLRAAGHRASARSTPRSCLRRHLRLRAGLRRLWLVASGALHGQITVATRTGPRTIAFERGTVQSRSGGWVVVNSADGVAWTWQIRSATRIVMAGQRVGPKALATGQRVFVIGQEAGGSDEARRIAIHG